MCDSSAVYVSWLLKLVMEQHLFNRSLTWHNHSTALCSAARQKCSLYVQGTAEV